MLKQLLLRPGLRAIGWSLPWDLGQRGVNAEILRPRLIKGAKYIFIGNQTFIHRASQLQAIESAGLQKFAPRITIGNNVYIGQNAFIASINRVTIEDSCVLSDYVYISDSAHGFDPNGGPIMSQPLSSRGPIQIGHDCFLGYRCVIMPGVILGNNCVVGANSVVTRSFPAYSMLAGVPARKLKVYSKEAKEWIRVS